MAVSVFTLIDRSVKNMGDINPQVRDLAIELIKQSYHKGIYIQITSGYRSNAEQTKLYNQGRTTPGSIVTNARAGQSIHNYGLAIDYVLVSEDGEKAFWDINRNMNGNQVRDWFEVAAIGKQLGFQWGGDWKSFKDYPHLDMQRGFSLSQLAAGKRPSIPSVPDRGYLGIGDSGPKIKALQEYLNKLGIKIAVDEDYGPATEAAVKLFQEKRGLIADGFYGPGSLAEMNKALKELSAPKAVVKPKPTPTVKPAAKEEPTMAERIFESATASLAKEWKKAYDFEITDGANPEGGLTRAQGAAFIVQALENEKIIDRIAEKVAEKLKK